MGSGFIDDSADVAEEDVLLDDDGAVPGDEEVAPYPLPGGYGTESDDGGDAAAPAGPAIGAAVAEEGGDPAAPFRPCASIFRDPEDLYAYLMLRGSKQMTEEVYGMVRAGFNQSSQVSLPSLTHVRRYIAPAVGSWMLPLCTVQAPLTGVPGTLPVQYVLPSSHVRRDVMFAATYDKFFSAEQRTSDERELEPEFVDSPFYTNRRVHLLSGTTVPRFNLDGERISVGDTIELTLDAPLPLVRVVVNDAYFCSYQSGVADNADVHAGDFIVVCDGDESGALVARQWQAMELPSLSWFPDSDPSVSHDVGDLQVVGVGDNAVPAGAANDEPVGALPGGPIPRRAVSGVKDGERYVVVPFCFSSDDFEARRGRSASLGGVYLSYLSWMYEDRRSSGASRTIAATPPGVNSDSILRAITPDLARGASEGWLCRAPDGSLLRVYADVCIFVGDYLQITKSSMMMGYSAKSPCPLCDYRIPGIPGSKFAHIGSSLDAGMARTTLRTRSICRASMIALSDLA